MCIICNIKVLILIVITITCIVIVIVYIMCNEVAEYLLFIPMKAASDWIDPISVRAIHEYEPISLKVMLPRSRIGLLDGLLMNEPFNCHWYVTGRLLTAVQFRITSVPIK